LTRRSSFDEAIVHLVGELVHMGKRILIAGLTRRLRAIHLGRFAALMAISDEVTKLSAVCHRVRRAAIHTQRLGRAASWWWWRGGGVRGALPRLLPPIPDAPRTNRWSCPTRSRCRRAIAARVRYFSPLRRAYPHRNSRRNCHAPYASCLAVSVSAFCLIAFTHYADSVQCQNQDASHAAYKHTLVVPIKTSSGRTAGSAAFKESKDGKQLSITVKLKNLPFGRARRAHPPESGVRRARLQRRGRPLQPRDGKQHGR